MVNNNKRKIVLRLTWFLFTFTHDKFKTRVLLRKRKRNCFYTANTKHPNEY